MSFKDSCALSGVELDPNKREGGSKAAYREKTTLHIVVYHYSVPQPVTVIRSADAGITHVLLLPLGLCHFPGGVFATAGGCL